MAAGLDVVDIDLAVVVDPNVELARRTADRYGYADATADLQRVVNDPSIDAISVALPNSVHAEVLPAILRSGKHVLTEKPIGRSAGEAVALVALAEQSPAVTGVGFSFRRLPGLAAVRNLIADGALGTVQSFTAWYNADYGASPDAPFSWRYAKETAGAGALIDIGTHAIDAVQHVIAPVRQVISSTLHTAITRRPISGIDRARCRRHRRHRANDGPDRRRCRRPDPCQPHRVRHPELAWHRDPRITWTCTIRLDRFRRVPCAH